MFGTSDTNYFYTNRIVKSKNSCLWDKMSVLKFLQFPAFITFVYLGSDWTNRRTRLRLTFLLTPVIYQESPDWRCGAMKLLGWKWIILLKDTQSPAALLHKILNCLQTQSVYRLRLVDMATMTCEVKSKHHNEEEVILMVNVVCCCVCSQLWENFGFECEENWI